MEKTIADELNEKFIPADLDYIEPLPYQESEKVGLDLSILKSPTGAGSIGDYLEHPMNFNSSKGMARVLRGLTGMMGSLDLAIIDITVGILDLLKTNKKAGVTNDNNGVYPIR